MVFEGFGKSKKPKMADPRWPPVKKKWRNFYVK